MTRSVHEILESAFNEIRDSHSLVVDSVHFEYIWTNSAVDPSAHFSGVRIDCQPLHKESGE